MLTPAHKLKKKRQIQDLLLILRSGKLPDVVFITHTYNCSTVKPDRSSNALDMYLVESLGCFLPNKPSSVPESHPNSEDESEPEDTSVA